jgi:hypothetical protein
MGKPDRRAIALADIDAATAQGIQAAAQDGVLESGDWGFELGSIRVCAITSTSLYPVVRRSLPPLLLRSGPSVWSRVIYIGPFDSSC